MNEHLRERIVRKLDTLNDDRGYQVLDFVEFLESKYAERARPTNIVAKISDTVEDAMRAGKLPMDAISGTMKIFDGASKVMRGLSSAAQTVVDEATKTIATPRTDMTQSPTAPKVEPTTATPPSPTDPVRPPPPSSEPSAS